MSSKLLVITSFPPEGIVHDKSVVGIASYAKNTLLALKKQQKELEITVLAEELNGKKEIYEDANLSIKRIWKRNSLLTFYTLLKETLLNESKTVLIEFEVAMFGDFIFLLPFPIFLLILKLFGKKVTIVCHQVISDIEDLSGHINLNGEFKIYFINVFIGFFYKLMITLASKIIVFDKILKEKLSKFGDSEKIDVIPHGVEDFKSVRSRNKTREELGFKENDFVLLYFGFLAWYKGTDLLIEYFKDINNSDKSTKLVIAGGPNPNHISKNYYQSYIRSIEEECKKNNIILTGFVREEDIPLYFQACDLVVLPYRTLMSASGPLSIAFSFQKPFVVSEALRGMFETFDINTSLNKLGIDKDALVFTNSEAKVKILKIKNDPVLRKNIADLSKAIAEKRNWQKIAQLYNETIF
jgi:glycosyltransferase involved in cell wall biosynthesis